MGNCVVFFQDNYVPCQKVINYPNFSDPNRSNFVNVALYIT